MAQAVAWRGERWWSAWELRRLPAGWGRAGGAAVMGAGADQTGPPRLRSGVLALVLKAMEERVRKGVETAPWGWRQRRLWGAGGAPGCSLGTCLGVWVGMGVGTFVEERRWGTGFRGAVSSVLDILVYSRHRITVE